MDPFTAPSHLMHDELSGSVEMAHDARQVRVNLRFDRAVRQAVAGPPSIEFDEFPTDRPKKDIRISDAAARLAGALHLHLD